VLGCAVAGLRDEVTAEWCDAPGVSLLDAGHPELPSDPARHTSAIAASAVLDEMRRRGARLPAPGIALTVRKALPLSGGQGGSAASAVAGAVAADALCGSVLDRTSLLACCLLAEERVAGRHLDNIAPSLLGGIVLVRSVDPIDVVSLPIPDGLRIVLAHPAQRLRTSDARGVLPSTIPRSVALHQMAQVGAIVAACHANDLALLGRSIDDRIAEPARAPLLPGFLAAKEAAMTAGALGASISGAGPTAFALVAGDEVAERVATAMRDAYAGAGVESTTRVTHVDPNGAVVKTA
jgi:homoserine kinase